jgi:hypothetical protein
MIQLSTKQTKGILDERGMRWDVYDPLGTLVYEGSTTIDIGLSNGAQIQCKRDDSKPATQAPVASATPYRESHGIEVPAEEPRVVGEVEPLCEEPDTVSVLDTVASDEGQCEAEESDRTSGDEALDQGIQFIEVEWT